MSEWESVLVWALGLALASAKVWVLVPAQALSTLHQRLAKCKFLCSQYRKRLP